MNSMTGFGKAEQTKEGAAIGVEIKSVNNRFFDCNLKAPKCLSFMEDAIKKTIQAKISRGKVEIVFTYRAAAGQKQKLTVDMELAKEYLMAAKQLRIAYGVSDDFQLSALLRSPDVVQRELTEDDETSLKDLVMKTLNQALKQHIGMRKKEGDALAQDIAERLQQIVQLLAAIKEFAPRVVSNYQQKMQSRIAELLNGIAVDQVKLCNEVAVFADKCNIDEEITRLTSHVEQCLSLFKQDQPCGRKLDFLVQEMNREANTMCAKANDIQITKYGLDLKCEIEKMREQVQNVE